MAEPEVIDTVTFQEPPPTRVLYDWRVIARRLKRRPMQWALIYEQDRVTVANAVRQGAVKAVHPDLGFEFQTRNNKRTPTRTCDLYMRYNPEKVKD